MSFRAAANTLTSPSRVRSMKIMRASSRRLSDIDNDIEEPVHQKTPTLPTNSLPEIVGMNGEQLSRPNPPESEVDTEKLARRAKCGTFLWILVGICLLGLAAVELNREHTATSRRVVHSDSVPMPAVAVCIEEPQAMDWLEAVCSLDPTAHNFPSQCEMTPQNYTNNHDEVIPCRVFNMDGKLSAEEAGQVAFLMPMVNVTDWDMMDYKALSMSFFYPNQGKSIDLAETAVIGLQTHQMVRMSASAFEDADGVSIWRYHPMITSLALSDDIFGYNCDDDSMCAIQIELSYSTMDVVDEIERGSVSGIVLLGALGGLFAFLKAMRTFTMTSYMVLTNTDASNEEKNEYVDERAKAACSSRCGVLVRQICNGL